MRTYLLETSFVDTVTITSGYNMTWSGNTLCSSVIDAQDLPDAIAIAISSVAFLDAPHCVSLTDVATNILVFQKNNIKPELRKLMTDDVDEQTRQEILLGHESFPSTTEREEIAPEDKMNARRDAILKKVFGE